MKMTPSKLLSIVLVTVLALSFFSIHTVANTGYETTDAGPEYNPWRDLNDDGIINIYDVVMVTGIYGSTGTPINKTELLLTRLQASCLLPLPYGAIAPETASNYSLGPDFNNILHWLDLDKDTLGNQMVIFTPEGANITVSGKFQNWQKPGIISQDFFIYSWTPSWPPTNETYYHPLYSGAPGGYPGLTQTFSFNLTVPNTPGVYYLYYCTGLEYSMTDAVNKYIEPLWFPYAVITVCSSP